MTPYPDVDGGRRWSIDFNGNTITLTHIAATDYMYSPGLGMPSFIGPHFSDPTAYWPVILSVTLLNAGASNLVYGFSASNVSFNANESKINVLGTMFHHHAMPNTIDRGPGTRSFWA